MNQFSLEFDRDYGISHRTGWSVIYNGCVIVQFQSNPIVALFKAFWILWCHANRRR